MNAEAPKILVFSTAENEEISSPPPRGFLIEIYLFYENWSTEAFRRKQSKKAGWLLHLQVRRLRRRQEMMISDGKRS